MCESVVGQVSRCNAIGKSGVKTNDLLNQALECNVVPRHEMISVEKKKQLLVDGTKGVVCSTNLLPGEIIYRF